MPELLCDSSGGNPGERGRCLMDCDGFVLGICLVKQAPAPTGLLTSLFGFPQFISALALLAVVYTVTDVRYRFRLAVAPVSLSPPT